VAAVTSLERQFLVLLLALAVPAARAQEPPALPRLAALPPLVWQEPRQEEPRVAGWTFEPIGYARDVGRQRVIRVGPEGDSELGAPDPGSGVLLRGRSPTARGDLVSAPFLLEPYRWIRVTVTYRVVAGEPLVFAALRPAADRALVDLEFVANRPSRAAKRAQVDLHSSAAEGPYSLALSVGGEGAVEFHAVTAEERGAYLRPGRPLCVLDIRSADPAREPSANFARVASLFGFPRVEYLHHTTFRREQLDAIDPALIILPGLASSQGLDSTQVDRAVLAAVDGDTPVVGVCFGHQVLARAHGAKLGRTAEWGPVRIEVVERDPLFWGLPRRGAFFVSESHDFAVVEPVGRMQAIGSSATCATQVFRYRGRPWYTFQGHIERGWEVATPEAVLLWKNMLRRWRLLPAPR
jgi:GMP synthase-like glutamine amidotransferase